YAVRRCVEADIVEGAVEWIKATLRTSWFTEERGARAIIYTRMKEQADEVGAALGCPVYYSDSGTDEEKGEGLEAWLRGEPQILAATSAFGAGIDYPHVRAVFHVGEPDRAIDFAQEVGRGGRDGEGSVAFVFLPRGWRAKSRDASGELLCRDAMMM